MIGEIKNFLNSFYGKNIILEDPLTWKKEFKNGAEIAEFIGVFIDNNYKYNINMWISLEYFLIFLLNISLDKNFFINITEYNAEQIIRYLFERYPY